MRNNKMCLPSRMHAHKKACVNEKKLAIEIEPVFVVDQRNHAVIPLLHWGAGVSSIRAARTRTCFGAFTARYVYSVPKVNDRLRYLSVTIV